MKKPKLVREHPALFLGELREDLERVYATEGRNIRVKGTEEVISGTLLEYPNDIEFEIVE